MCSILERWPRLIDRQLMKNIHYRCTSQSKKVHWSKQLKTHCDRALEHYDDFYLSVYKNKWPSLRLGLLCEPKYMAFPNPLTGDLAKISSSLEDLGALSVEPIWSKYNSQFERELEEKYLASEAGRLKTLDMTLEKIARTKQAEELEVLYQNAPKMKLTSEPTFSNAMAGGGGGEVTEGDSRVIRDIREASQEYVTETRLKGIDDFLMESEYYASYTGTSEAEQNSGYIYTTQNNFTKLKFPFNLRPFSFEPGNPSLFPSAPRNVGTGLREYICVNGSSFAPVMALDLKPAVHLLDLCSGPGTKSLLALFTGCPSILTCNDVDHNRLLRVKRLFNEFTGSTTPPGVMYTRYNAAHYPEGQFHRVLADVPCLSDRVSCTVPDNNIFKPTRLKERLGLVHVQKKILLSAFTNLVPETGSCCVYSTCTLSPIENDGAVGAALRETPVKDLQVDLFGLWHALKPLEQAGFYHMSRTKFGVMIEPNVVSNFGPMYVSRIVVNRSSVDSPPPENSQPS